MSLPRALSITKRLFRELRRDKRTIALIFLAPIFAMFVFGLAFSGEVHDIKLIIVNEDEGFNLPLNNSTLELLGELGFDFPVGLEGYSLSENIISNLDEDVLDVKYMDEVDDAVEEVKNGDAYGVLHFHKHFTKNVLLNTMISSFPTAQLQNSTLDNIIFKIFPNLPEDNATIQLMLDKSNINVASEISKTVSEAIMETIEDSGYELPITLDTENAIYGKDADFMDFFVPGIMAFVVYLLTTLLTLITFVSERTSGTLERILATPTKESEIVIGYAIAFSVLGTIQAGVLLIVGIVVFDILIIGNVLIAFLAIALLAITCQALGILFSSLARREAQAVQFLPFIILPAFLLAGIFWPIEAIPAWLRPASYLVPPTYAVEACRGVMLKGWGFERIWIDIVALLIFAAVFLVMAMGTLRRRRD
jgi:ABC-2 type transport system permease protein